MCEAVHPNTQGQPFMFHSQSEPRAEERRAYRIPDFCWRYSVSRSSVYKLAKEGRLRLVKVGGRTLVLHEDAEALLRESP
jgi:excisionase family DNA binding protein